MDDLRVLIIADDPLVRGGLAALLRERCTVVGQAAPDADPLALYAPDVVLWDLGWDPAGVPEAFEGLVEASSPIVVLLPDTAFAAQLWTAGARGLLPRDADADRVLAALSAVACGLTVHDPALAMVPMFVPPVVSAADLTPREEDVLHLLAEGTTNRAIAHRLNISEHTVKFHINAILGKLHAQSRTEAVVQAIRLGLIRV